jgi:hypothetical protein
MMFSIAALLGYGTVTGTRFYIGFNAFDVVLGARGTALKEVSLGAPHIMSDARLIQAQCYAPVKHTLALGSSEFVLLTCSGWGPPTY